MVAVPGDESTLDTPEDIEDEWDASWGRYDPAGGKPLTGYEEDIQELLAEETPRRFAIVQDWGDRYDSRIAAWGLAYPGGEIHILDVTYGRTDTVKHDLDRALWWYGGRKPWLSARVFWIDDEQPKQLGLHNDVPETS
jgi:hypothetical protein